MPGQEESAGAARTRGTSAPRCHRACGVSSGTTVRHCHLVSPTWAGAHPAPWGPWEPWGGGPLGKPALPLFARAKPALIPSATGPALLTVHLLTSSTCQDKRGQTAQKGAGGWRGAGQKARPSTWQAAPPEGLHPRSAPRQERRSPRRGVPSTPRAPTGLGGARCPIPPREAGAAANNPGIEEPPVRAHLQLRGPAEDKANVSRW